MKNVHNTTLWHKYKIGETVKIKNSFNSTASAELKTAADSIVKIVDHYYYTKPYYEVEGLEGLIPEGAILEAVTA